MGLRDQAEYILNDLKRYRDAPESAPTAVLAELGNILAPCRHLTPVIANGAGAEGIVIAFLTVEGNKILYKVAFPCTEAQQKKEDITDPEKPNIFARLFPSKRPGENIEEKQKRIQYITLERFIRGAKTQKKLHDLVSEKKNPMLVVPGHAVHEQPWPHLEMFNVEGLKIVDALRNPQRPLRFCIEIFLRLLKCMEFVHRLGIVHRDLKNENIMLTGNIRDAYDLSAIKIAILDWTLAKEIGDESHLTLRGETKLGTIPQAPLKFYVDAEPDRANYSDDICYLAYDMWEILTCKYLPRPSDPGVFFHAHSKRQYNEEIAQYLPHPLRKVFLKAAEPEEKQRYPIIPQFQKDFVEAIGKIRFSDNSSEPTEIKGREPPPPIKKIKELPTKTRRLEKPVKSKHYELADKILDAENRDFIIFWILSIEHLR